MMEQKEIKKRLEECETNKQMCKICGEKIPGHIKRISFSFNNKFGISFIRICERCIFLLNKNVNKKKVEAWTEELRQQHMIKNLKS